MNERQKLFILRSITTRNIRLEEKINKKTEQLCFKIMITFMCFTYNIKYYVRPILVFQKCGLTVQFLYWHHLGMLRHLWVTHCFWIETLFLNKYQIQKTTEMASSNFNVHWLLRHWNSEKYGNCFCHSYWCESF